MKFLLEAPNEEEQDSQTTSNEKDDKEKVSKAHIRPLPPELSGDNITKLDAPDLQTTFDASVDKFGKDLNTNPVYRYINTAQQEDTELSTIFNTRYVDHFKYVANKLLNDELEFNDGEEYSLTSTLLSDPSFYNRPLKDFAYILQVLPILSNEQKSKQYFANPKLVKLNDLYLENGNVKSAEEIKSIVNSWWEEDQENYAKQSDGEYSDTDKTTTSYSKLNTHDEQVAYIKRNVINQPQFRDLFGIRDIIIQAMLTGGIERSENPFIDFLLKLPFQVKDRQKLKPKFQYIYDLYKANKLDLKKLEVLKNYSLYDRSDAEFKYTLNAFNLFSDPKKAGVYLKDVTKVDLTQFMDGNVVKPAGLNKAPGDTIYNVIDSWAKDNEYSREEINSRSNDNSETIYNVLKQSQQNYPFFEQVINTYYSKAEVQVDKNTLNQLAYTAFVVPKVLKEYDTINDAQTVMVDNASVSAVKSQPHSVKPRKDIAPGAYLILQNTKDNGDDVEVLYAFEKLIGLSKGTQDLAQGQESLVNTIQDELMDAPIQISDKKNKEEIGIQIVKALANLCENQAIIKTMNTIWKENIV